ncbi:MAG: LemA family protein [Pseudomonadota bacterium]
MSLFRDSLVYWMAGAILLFWFVGAYNRLMRLRATALQAYATLDAALLRQLDFVQMHSLKKRADDAFDPSDAALVSLHATTAQLTTLLAVTRQKPLTVTNIAALATALHVMLAAWQRLHPDAVMSFEPDGTLARVSVPTAGTEDASDAKPSIALTAWPEPSAAAEIARSQFNQAVTHYNAAIRQFPAVLVAWVMQLHPAAALG